MSRWDRMGREATIRVPATGRSKVMDPGGWPDGDTVAAAEERFVMEVVTVSGRAAAVEFRICDDAVQVWHLDHCNATFDREVLRTWLATPDAPLVVDEVAFTVDRMVDRSGRVAVSLPDILAWTLAPDALAGLRQRL
jgi:hypothetical protein